MHHLLVIEYRKIVEGKIKKPKEKFLVEAISLGEIEKIVAEIFKTRLKDPQWHSVTQLRALDNVIFHSGTLRSEFEADHFYQVKAKFFDTNYEYYVPAEHADQAIQRVLEFYPSLERKYITLVKATDILGVWDPNSMLWQGDFHNRQELLYDNDQRNYDRNQTEIEGTQTQPANDTEFAPREWAVGDIARFPDPDEGPEAFIVLESLDKNRALVISNYGDVLRVDLDKIHGEKLSTGLTYEFMSEDIAEYDFHNGLFYSAFRSMLSPSANPDVDDYAKRRDELAKEVEQLSVPGTGAKPKAGSTTRRKRSSEQQPV
ncbi:DUF4494 family protein [Fibrella sp. ES10-3-2-2]|nr:hypothetical protein A6C57_01300 [Fibrella sp. ES10-3-2-2]